MLPIHVTLSIVTHLVWKTSGIKPPLIRNIPPTITHMVDRKPVALGPVTIELAHIVKATRVVVGGLEVLRLEQLVAFGKVELPQLLLSRRTAQACDLGDGASVTCKEGRGPRAVATAHEAAGAGDHVRTGLGHARRLVSTTGHHHGWLLHVDWLGLGDEAWLLGLEAVRVLL